MDIRQLRAGNLVTTNGKPAGTTNGNVYKVLSTDSANRLDELKLIGGATIEILDGEYRTTVGAWLDYLDPIEITDDLLRKIGFPFWQKSCSGRVYLRLGDYSIEIDPIDKYILYIRNNRGYEILSARIKYLHDIQNLIFDITNLELNVENLITK